MNNVTRDAAIRKMSRIRWVESVEAASRRMPDSTGTARGFIVRTCPETLSTFLEYTIKPAPNGKFDIAGKMERTIVKLPQYNIYVFKNWFLFQLVNKPNPNTGLFGIIPTYHERYDEARWDRVYLPCYGYSSTLTDYRGLRKWEDKLLYAAQFLQGAIPHYNLDWWRTDFAYRLGLVGEEVLAKASKEEEEMIERAKAERVNIIGNHGIPNSVVFTYATATAAMAALQQQHTPATNATGIQQHTPPNIIH